MKDQIQTMQRQVITLLKSPSIQDPGILSQLAVIPSKLRSAEQRIDEIEGELARVAQLLEQLSDGASAASLRQPEIVEAYEAPARRGQRTKIKIRIDRQLWGLEGGVETICESTAAESLVRFVTRLYQARGVRVLEELSRLHVNRGPFVSRNPERDYRYVSGPEERHYQCRPVADSGFFVLTGTETEQKVSDIKKLCQFLRLPAGSVHVEKIGSSTFPVDG